MMTAKELYQTFAASGPWGRWTKPVLFHHLRDGLLSGDKALQWHGVTFHPGAAWIIDLPGTAGFAAAQAAVENGLAPVPLYNSAPGFNALIDNYPLIEALVSLGEQLKQARLPATAPPAFLIDSDRFPVNYFAGPGKFDNRWMIFPQDFPSHHYLREHGIRKVCVLAVGDRVADDLAHVLRRWQEGGIPIHQVRFRDGVETLLNVPKPSAFRHFFRCAMVMLGLRRSAAGGFGAMVPFPSEASGMG